MNFNKPMIDLIREIRRRASSDSKPTIKLANPNLLHELIPIHHTCGDTITKTLIKELFSMAGAPWPEALEHPQAVEDQRFVTKIYRGQTQLEPAATQVTHEVHDKPKLIYRGRVVS